MDEKCLAQCLGYNNHKFYYGSYYPGIAKDININKRQEIISNWIWKREKCNEIHSSQKMTVLGAGPVAQTIRAPCS